MNPCCLRSREGEFAVGDGNAGSLLAARGSGEGSETVVVVERHFYKKWGGLELVWYYRKVVVRLAQHNFLEK